MGPPSTNRKVSNWSIIQIVIFCIIAVVVIGVNFWHISSCNTNIDEEELKAQIDALNRRLLIAESKVIHIAYLLMGSCIILWMKQNTQNNHHMEKLIHKLQRSLSHVEQSELNRLEEVSQEESVKISLLLASQPIPKMPEFQLNGNDIEKIADIVDDVLGQSPKDLENFANGNDNVYGTGNEEPISVVSDADAHKQCTEWKDRYNVDVGTTWGTLPFELQEKWIAMGCDYHLDS